MNNHLPKQARAFVLAGVILSGSLWAHTAAALDSPAATPLTVAHATRVAAIDSTTDVLFDMSRVTREFRVEVRENLRTLLAADIDRTLAEAKVIAD